MSSSGSDDFALKQGALRTISLSADAWWVPFATRSVCRAAMGLEAEIASATMAVDPERMIHPDEARATIFRYLWRLPAERISLREASWRVLAGDLVATEDQPPFPAATMDGYAVVADDPSPWREIIGRQSAGYVADLEVSLGTAAWITTGAPVPSGATAVVPVEATELADEHVIVHQERVAAGENIRPVGVDLAQGIRGVAARKSPRRRGDGPLGQLGDRSGGGRAASQSERLVDRE